MSADWEEVKRLAADFQRAQLSSTIQRLSERNCIEIVKKLLELKLIDVIFTNDGKEYLTPQRLLKEIKDELIVHGGRINLVDLAQIIGVDFNHVENKASEFVQSEPDVRLVLGQLISNEYLDHLAEEVNEKLHQAGEIAIAELTKIYNLPGDFLEEVIHDRLGTIIQGQADCNDSRTFFTDSYLAQHTARICGALSALTRPAPVSALINHFKFPEKLFYNVTDNLIKKGRIAGALSGGHSERAVFLPDIYAKCQNEWVDAFYLQNGYLEYDALVRLGIQDPKTYIRKKFKGESITYLNSLCVGKNILNQVEATVEEVLNSGMWVDVMPVLPSIFSTEDCHGIITEVTKSMPKQSILHIYCDTIIASDDLIKTCYNSFDSTMSAKAQEDIMQKPQYFTAPQSSKTASVKKETVTKPKQDRKEERKIKKHSGGKSGGGTQGRETKTKAVKKKYHTSKEAEESGSEEELNISSKDSKLELDFLSVTDIENHLKTLNAFKECSEDLIQELAIEMHRPLTKKYQEYAKTVYTSTQASSGANRRKQHADYQEKFTNLLNYITMYEKGAKIFPDDTSAQLYKHLLKTLCSDLVNMIVNYLAIESGLISNSDGEATFTTELRLKMINKFSEDIKQPLLKLHSSLNEKTLEEFQSTIQVALGCGVCDMIVRKLDKKKEKLLLSNQRHSLLSQLDEVTDPALCLHLAVLLIFQSHTHNMLHASGKFVPQIIFFLQKQVPLELYQLLSNYQELVIKKLTPNDEESTDVDSETALKETLPKIKEAAITYKNSNS